MIVHLTRSAVLFRQRVTGERPVKRSGKIARKAAVNPWILQFAVIFLHASAEVKMAERSAFLYREDVRDVPVVQVEDLPFAVKLN